MSALAPNRLLTGQELFELGEIGPCELIDGRIVGVSPTGAEHSNIEGILVRIIGNFVDEHDLGWVLPGEVGIYTRHNPDRVRGADIAFLPRAQNETVPEGFLRTAPDMVAEVVSPNDRWREIQEKIDEYFAIGVAQVWIVEPKMQQILVYHSPTRATRYRRGETLEAPGRLEGLEIPIDRVFS